MLLTAEVALWYYSQLWMEIMSHCSSNHWEEHHHFLLHFHMTTPLLMDHLLKEGKHHVGPRPNCRCRRLRGVGQASRMGS